MTALELSHIGMYGNIVSLSLGLAAAYKVFMDKFKPPGLERAEQVCSDLRGQLSNKLADCCRPFVESCDGLEVTDVQLYGSDDTPLEKPPFTRRPAIDSEKFKEAVQSFLHDRSSEFERYWMSFVNKRRLQFIWACVRFAVAAWPALSLLGICVFGMWAKELTSLPSYVSVFGLVTVTAAPVVVFVLCLIPYAACSNKLAALE